MEGRESGVAEERQDSEEMDSSAAQERDLRAELHKSVAKTVKLRLKLRGQKRKNAALHKKNVYIEKKLESVFSKDQIRALSMKNKKNMKWGNDTIKKALRIHFTTGTTGYKLLQDMKIPLPDIRTLQRRLQHIKMQPGVLVEVFDMLKLKVDGLSSMERECVLTLDEMSITTSVELHLGSGKLYGDITLPDHQGEATHALVFMLAGSTTRWKQVVAFHYSGNSTAGKVYKPIILDIIERATNIGLHVVCITTDMGSPNQAMWRAFGVDHKQTSVPHPSKPDRRLYFMPDVPHLIKNLRSALVSGQPFLIPPETVEKENLPSNKVLVTPLKDLVNFQEGSALKIAPNLSRNILHPSHFDKMKVGPAVTLFGKSTTAGLKYMVAKEDRPHSYLTTAWFLEQVGHWFDLMSSRHPVMALSKNNMEEYDKSITFMEDIINLFFDLKIGQPARWKPVQAGVVMATRTILALQNDMLSQGHAFVLTSRFSQDCLENLFSCIRQRNPVPTPVEFHRALRAISVGQFLSTVKSSSYQEDDNDLIADFLEGKETSPRPAIRVEELMEPSNAPDLTQTETCALYHLTGYIVCQVISHASICDECKSAIKHNDRIPEAEHSVLLRLKEYKPGALCWPSEEAFEVVQNIEMLFRSRTSASLMKLPNAFDLLQREARLLENRLPLCHDVQNKIADRYIRLRLKIAAKHIRAERAKTSSNKGYLGSKSQTKSQTKKTKNTDRQAASCSTVSKPPSNPMIVAMEVFGLTSDQINVPPPQMAMMPSASSAPHQPHLHHDNISVTSPDSLLPVQPQQPLATDRGVGVGVYLSPQPSILLVATPLMTPSYSYTTPIQQPTSYCSSTIVDTIQELEMKAETGGRYSGEYHGLGAVQKKLQGC